MSKIFTCPECKDDTIQDRWVNGRKLQRSCSECSWKEEPRTPERRKVTGKKHLHINAFPGWQYEAFDRFGHLSTISRTYDSEKAAMVDVAKQIQCGLKKGNPAGPYTVVLYNVPYRVTISGTIIKKISPEQQNQKPKP